MPTTVLGYKPVHSGTYVPRIVHIPKETMKAIIGGASHEAWIQLIAEGVTKPGSGIRVPFKAHKERTRLLIQEAVSEYVKAHVRA